MWQISHCWYRMYEAVGFFFLIYWTCYYLINKSLMLSCLWFQDGYTMTVCLWREAAVYNLNVGDHISLSHMKWSQSSYGLQLHSTAFTRIVNKCLEIDFQIWHNIIYHHCCGHNRNAKPAGGFAGEWTKPVHWQWAVESLW